MILKKDSTAILPKIQQNLRIKIITLLKSLELFNYSNTSTKPIKKSDLKLLCRHLKEILTCSHFGPLHFLWVYYVEDFYYLLSLTFKLPKDFHINLEKKDSSYEVMEVAYEVLDYWMDSDLATIYIRKDKTGESIHNISLSLLKIYLDQIFSLWMLHLSKNKVVDSQKIVAIQMLPDLPRVKHAVILYEHQIFFQNRNLKELTSKYVKEIKLKNGEIVLAKGDVVSSSPLDDISIHYISQGKDKTVLFLAQNMFTRPTEYKKLRAKLERALHTLEIVSPKGLKLFSVFTNTIISIKWSGIVSYSSERLPGHSNINLYERDFIDLLDDLLHENGHHQLNALLSIKKLINEDDERIYYSPWREALRPIRGIYHAVFTFYFAHQLFKDLIQYLNKNTPDQSTIRFSQKEQTKIYLRFIEEHLMIGYCEEDIEHAYLAGKVSKQGYALMQEIFSELRNSRKVFTYAIKQLKKQSKINYEKAKKLETNLARIRKHYKYNELL